MTLNEVMKETADAIREKTGKSELIKPVNFAEEIKGITAGGGDAPSGGSGNRYFNANGLGEVYGQPAIYAIIGASPVSTIKISLSGGISIVPTDSARTLLDYNAITADDVLAIQIADTKLYADNRWETANDTLNNITAIGITLTEITEAEFYDLNA